MNFCFFQNYIQSTFGHVQQVGGFSTQPTMDTQPTFYMQAFLGEVAWYSGTQGVKPKHRLKKDPALSSHVVLRSNTFFFLLFDPGA